MSENILIDPASGKADQYSQLLPQIDALIHGEPSQIANMANIAAALKQGFNWWWVGFYLVDDDELVLGPFQGPVACTRIGLGKGVCGTAWKEKKSIIVPDVDLFPGHIACSSLTRSEIVVPIIKNNTVVAVLDVDSEHRAYFNETDRQYLEQLCHTISSFL
jgi:L-methionine (R)-S-oxide reductase